MLTPLSQFHLHEYWEVVGVGEGELVVVETFYALVVEDIVDAYGFATAVSVHKSTATLFETIYHVAKHCVVDIRVRHVVEVAAENARKIAITYFVRHDGSLACPDNHANGLSFCWLGGGCG